jgi:hypothetical protein
MKPKTAALVNVPAVVKSPKLPAVRWKAFTDFENHCDDLVEIVQVIGRELKAGRDVSQSERQWLEEAKAKVRAGWLIHGYDDNSNYDDEGVIRHKPVAERIALLVGSFPNAAPPSPKVYARMMIEHVIAENPTITILESACREIERALKFPPTIAEVIQTLRARTKLFSERERARMFDVDDMKRLCASKQTKQVAAKEAIKQTGTATPEKTPKLSDLGVTKQTGAVP